ncbi:hypothetical protein C8T65DRAFT_50265 [Cerioporus squamosus]|nr:hypothetical protein C8T65DRAFT_50265 [Cerioporus squamosus]
MADRMGSTANPHVSQHQRPIQWLDDPRTARVPSPASTSVKNTRRPSSHSEFHPGSILTLPKRSVVRSRVAVAEWQGFAAKPGPPAHRGSREILPFRLPPLPHWHAYASQKHVRFEARGIDLGRPQCVPLHGGSGQNLDPSRVQRSRRGEGFCGVWMDTLLLQRGGSLRPAVPCILPVTATNLHAIARGRIDISRLNWLGAMQFCVHARVHAGVRSPCSLFSVLCFPDGSRGLGMHALCRFSERLTETCRPRRLRADMYRGLESSTPAELA